VHAHGMESSAVLFHVLAQPATNNGGRVTPRSD
jgi:hypothetical protein